MLLVIEGDSQPHCPICSLRVASLQAVVSLRPLDIALTFPPPLYTPHPCTLGTLVHSAPLYTPLSQG